MSRLRIAVIGCGRISSVYEEAFDKLKDEIQLVLAFDKVLYRAREMALKHPGCLASNQVDLNQFRKVLRDVKPDLLHILLPHHLHGVYAIAAMECGVHVLTEKPVTISLLEADQLIEVQKRTGMQLGVIFQNRYIEGVQEVKNRISSGVFGNVRGVFSTLNWYRPESYYQCDWKGKWETEGGGVVIDQAIHSIDLVRYMTGLEARRVMAHTSRRILTKIEVEDEADAAVWLENGAIYSFYACNYYTANSPIRIEISCEKATALLTYDKMEITLEDGTVNKILPEACHSQNGESYWGNYHYYQIRDCYNALRNGTRMPWTAEDARKTLMIVQGIYQSSRLHEAVDL